MTNGHLSGKYINNSEMTNAMTHASEGCLQTMACYTTVYRAFHVNTKFVYSLYDMYISMYVYKYLDRFQCEQHVSA